MRIKKGDLVQVISGRSQKNGGDRGKQGKVIAVYPDTQRVLVEGINRVTKHEKAGASARGTRTGGLIHTEAPIHVSNVAVVDPETRRSRRGSRPASRPWSATVGRRPAASAWPCAPVRTCDDRNRHGDDGDPYLPAPQAALPRRDQAGRCVDQFSYGNVMQIPGVVKVVVNMGVGDAAKDSKLIEGAVRDLGAITGQKPIVTKARKSIAQFKLREGMPIGAHTTLRGDRMWEFLDRLVTIALPRIRDFRGLSPKQFDGNGNYTFGLTEQSMFHEIDQDRIDRVRGMDITVVTTANNDDEGRALLKALGFPFKEN